MAGIPTFPSTERNQTEEAIAYALARGKDLRTDEASMLAMIQDDPGEFMSRLFAARNEAGIKGGLKRPGRAVVRIVVAGESVHNFLRRAMSTDLPSMTS